MTTGLFLGHDQNAEQHRHVNDLGARLERQEGTALHYPVKLLFRPARSNRLFL